MLLISASIIASTETTRHWIVRDTGGVMFSLSWGSPRPTAVDKDHKTGVREDACGPNSQCKPIGKIHHLYFLKKGFSWFSLHSFCLICGQGHFNVGVSEHLSTTGHTRCCCWQEFTIINCLVSELTALTKILTKTKSGLSPFTLDSLCGNGTFEDLVI